jgi:multidrug efflux pump
MNISRIFILRPIATSLLMIGVVLAGALAFAFLPVAVLPQADFPTIQIWAELPGASAETMASSVATPLERSMANTAGLTSMTSSSSLGNTSITLQFDLDRNIDAAAQDVQAAINAASASLPKEMPAAPAFWKVNPADASIMSLALTSDTLPLTEVTRRAGDLIAYQLSQISGVGYVGFHGEQKPAVRVRVDPSKLAQLGLTPEDVRAALGVATLNAPKGSLNGPDRAIILDATDQISDADAYKGLVVAYRNGAPIRISDIGTAVNAAEDVRRAAWLQGRRAVILDVYKQPGVNVLEITQRIREVLPVLSGSLPPSIDLTIVGDRTQTIRASVSDVQMTLAITVGLVVMVIFLFLRNIWATLIPAIAIPLALVATFGAMYLLGYSLDNLSLMGLTIAVGFVVDDAIVVIENVVRHVEHGMRPREAALAGAREVGFTVLSMTVSLVAVFIPVLFMGGVIGRLFREFAVTVAVAVVMSAIVSLTVSPMLCARFLRQHRPEEHGRLYRLFERGFETMAHIYERGLDAALRHQALVLAATIVTVAATAYCYVIVPKGFFPQEDTGLIIGVAEAGPDVSFAAMSDRIQALARIVRADPDVDNVYYWAGPNPTLSQGRLMINLKPAGERTSTADQVIERLRPKVAKVEDIALFMQVRQDIQVGGRFTKTQYQFTLQDANTDELAHWASVLQHRFTTIPELQDVTTDAQNLAPRTTLRIDRDTASRFGITAQAIDDTLYDAFGQRQVATIYTQLDQYHVILELDPTFQANSSTLKSLYVRSPTTGQPVPMSLLASFDQSLAPITINHQGLFPSVTLSFNLAPGHSIGDAVTAVNAALKEYALPSGLVTSFQGTAQAFRGSLRSQPYLIAAAIIAVYIILGVLYESYIHPLTILSTLPSAGVGALLALMLFRLDLSIMGLIGIILLIGIVKKNAIMMIDFAIVAQREERMSPLTAIRSAALLRFRPIMMTTMSALLGALPLALGSGVGAELRRPLGITVIGGLLLSQILTLYTTPVIYLYLERLSNIPTFRLAARSRRERADALEDTSG